MNARRAARSETAASGGRGPEAPPVAATPCTAACLRRAARRVTAFYEPYLWSAGLTLSQYSLLSNLSHEAQSQSRLAARLEMDRTTLTRNLKPLIERHLVAVAAGADARQRWYSLTRAGHALRREARGRWTAAQQALESTLGPGLVAILHRGLDRALSKLKPMLPKEN